MAKQKRAVLIANGCIKSTRTIKRILVDKFDFNQDYFIAAADGGALNSLELNIIPDVIIGDMDSITAGIVSRLNSKIGTAKIDYMQVNNSGKNNKDKTDNQNLSGNNTAREVKFMNFKKDKDESDTQLCLDYLVNEGFDKILILGALGGKEEHSLANIFLLSNPSYDSRDIRILTENSEIFVMKKSFNIQGETGKKISFFSLTPFTYFINISGFKYKLKNEKLLFSPVRGLSNEFIKNNAKVEISEGILLIVKEL